MIVLYKVIDEDKMLSNVRRDEFGPPRLAEVVGSIKWGSARRVDNANATNLCHFKFCPPAR
jgi:hypothetical protein